MAAVGGRDPDPVGGAVDVPTDAQLLAAVSSGDVAARGAWAELVSRHSARMYAVARSVGLDVQTSEDLVQTAWLRLLERGHQLRDGAAVRAWLCTIVRNEAIKTVARRREVPTDVLLDHVADPAAGGLENLLSAERASAVRLAFARLGEDCRQLLRLSIADPPLSYDDIAIAVGRPRGSLGPTRRRCLERLRQLLPAGFAESDAADNVSGRPTGGSIRRDGTADEEGTHATGR